jgi:hypothetical protein
MVDSQGPTTVAQYQYNVCFVMRCTTLGDSCGALTIYHTRYIKLRRGWAIFATTHAKKQTSSKSFEAVRKGSGRGLDYPFPFRGGPCPAVGQSAQVPIGLIPVCITFASCQFNSCI